MACALSYDSYADLWNKIDVLRLDGLERLIGELLRQTENLYEKSFGALMETHFQIWLEDMKSWDVHRIACTPQFTPFSRRIRNSISSNQLSNKLELTLTSRAFY